MPLARVMYLARVMHLVAPALAPKPQADQVPRAAKARCLRKHGNAEAIHLEPRTKMKAPAPRMSRKPVDGG